MMNNFYSDGFELVTTNTVSPPPMARIMVCDPVYFKDNCAIDKQPHLNDTASAAMDMVGSIAKTSGDITKSVLAEKESRNELAGKKTELASAVIGGKNAAKGAEINAKAMIATGAAQQKTILIVAVVFAAVFGLGIFAYFELSEDKLDVGAPKV